jgi:hypothetical protein
MNKQNHVHKSAGETGKWTALVVAASVLLTFPLYAQKTDDASLSASGPANQPAVATTQQTQQDIVRELDAMKRRIEQLEAELQKKNGQGTVSAVEGAETAPRGPNVPEVHLVAASFAQPSIAQPQSAVAAATSTKPRKIEPFSDWDWTWLNGNPRNKDVAFDSKFFTPEIRADITYNYDFNKPIDNSIGGSSEIFRSNEIQLEQLGIGGDFHYDNVRARFMTQFGNYSETTPRNDPSPAKGQWDLDTADRYIAEAYGGYHINALNGINIDAGIFLSYIGLFSYYNADNNSRKGLGGQIKWTPRPWVNIISNNYGLGHDDLYIPNRGRVHTDNSIEVKYFDRPGQTLDKMAFSFTGDLGCEFGPSTATLAGVSCFGDRRDSKAQPSANFPQGGIDPKQSFIGYMLYNRMWFKKDTFGLTVGGGQINNPGRYLVLDPPINGETAPSAAINAPYFTGNPGDPFKAWDSSLTFDYMPRQWLTFRWEYDYRHASVPYWTGHGGITPPGPGGVPYTNNGYPQYFACLNGNSSMQETLSGAENPNISGSCTNQGSTVWFPDLRRDQSIVDIDILVKF